MNKDDDGLDAHLDVILIGGREEREIQIVDYSEEWPLRFQDERQRPKVRSGGQLTGSSTSTPPPCRDSRPRAIVDIMVTVENPGEESAFVPDLERAGYVLRVREPGHRMLRTPSRDIESERKRLGLANDEVENS